MKAVFRDRKGFGKFIDVPEPPPWYMTIPYCDKLSSSVRWGSGDDALPDIQNSVIKRLDFVHVGFEDEYPLYEEFIR